MGDAPFAAVRRAAQPTTVPHAWQTRGAFGRTTPACRHPNPRRIGTGSNSSAQLEPVTSTMRSRASSLVTILPMPRDTDNPTVTNLTMRWMNSTTRARNGSWSQGSASREPSKAVENHETSCEALEKLSYEWREECNDDAKFCWRIAGEPSNAD